MALYFLFERQLPPFNFVAAQLLRNALSLANKQFELPKVPFLPKLFSAPKIALRERAKICVCNFLKHWKTTQTNPNGYFFALQKLLSKKKKVLRKKET